MSGSQVTAPTGAELTTTPGGEPETARSTADENRRQVLYWRLLARLFDPEEQPSLEAASVAIVDDIGLPAALLDPTVSVDTLVQRFPELAAEFEGLMAPPDAGGPAPAEHGPTQGPAAGPDSQTAGAGEEGTAPGGGAVGVPAVDVEAAPRSGPRDHTTASEQPAAPGLDRVAPVGAAEVRRAALVSKLLLNVFATGSGEVTATDLARWQSDAGWFERALGCEAGQLRGRPGASELGGVLAGLEGDLVRRMRLREVLANSALARQLTPSMSLIEQLLRDKANLSGVALANAKALIRRFVDEVAEVLRTQVEKTSVGKIDRSVPPKRVFRNLDLERTIWKNLTNWSPEDQRLYVDRLYYRHTARRTTPARLIVVVDQSGSMVDAMVNCTILASIFAGLPKVDVHLVAYDTRALDLTPWVHDPFEVLLRTQLGGGTDGMAALQLVRPKVAEPKNTVLVWISDYYESNPQGVFEALAALHRSGVRVIPVGSVNSGGQQSVNPWFRQHFKDLGTPVISGHIRKLVFELKSFLS
ncbi:VWA domain-containing protein [Micromonospora sp. HM5-17]|uniref:VWA domain-containing protein n=1 Tax=Micromonospora sp. HM5-17 TaxID=2487710 RepID=UPI000F46741F|nr:VWA domain-containing protein [Micromonospora sp. HM5-17]ROT28209.1 VWA domain-containing protein [Micromonospora sp. HM5-17]